MCVVLNLMDGVRISYLGVASVTAQTDEILWFDKQIMCLSLILPTSGM